MKLWVLLVLGVLATATLSLFIGVADFSLAPLGWPDEAQARLTLLWVSRVPRSLALVFAGAATAVAGLIMQMLLRNRYIEPAMVGTVEGACLGMLLALIVAPGIPVFGRMLMAFVGAIAVTGLFLAILSRLPLRSVLIVPLTGIILAGIVDAATNFIAFNFELQQSLAAWRLGDFAQVLSGRWELLWLAFALTLVAAFVADRFTIAGLGRDTATSLGLNHRRVMALGLVIVSAVSASVVVTVGVIPFLGLVVPNLVSLVSGDNLRRAVPLTALAGALFALVCDVLGRLLNWPFEVPIGVIIGIVGSATFLWILARERRRLG
ncbi:MAG: iron ABC transporter permease [Candidatus Dactylopiibacterium carminicum]|uniref:Iron ABC transporter permease n=1 Tax=Candidatus Dactylopiibacterium carminicum TaxID=857335 RepID=A0A272EUJ2_9RHOO|nr:iron chelate uptake ABC transporter family permease subunit [Candidatus Dactylopiibacterium carminicum]KAF7600391.1 iron ABC transporter permease [Candidatus Dactylopiibacterium carminicum]PAS93781.1 MAG: iron ABC transporter permease [Candidatus Dactylopiibacterium carminicum]PAT00390.1 MAG: iron ABC transporter permease [Candidatus Dactylopiibacterium carminicum]